MGSKPSRSTFLRFLESNNKRKKHGNIGKNRNFDEDILLISTENQNFVDISAEISDIWFPAEINNYHPQKNIAKALRERTKEF